MINLLPFLALGAVAIGFASAMDRAEKIPEPEQVQFFSAASNPSIDDFVGRIPQTVQDPLCDAEQAIKSQISEDFAESRKGTLPKAGIVRTEVWASDLMGTWTLITINDDRLACITASGFGWTSGMTLSNLLDFEQAPS